MEGGFEYVRLFETKYSVTIFIINDDTPSEPIQINKGLRNGCGFYPIIFNVYINEILQEFEIAIRAPS
jgi:hypothetical protein